MELHMPASKRFGRGSSSRDPERRRQISRLHGIRGPQLPGLEAEASDTFIYRGRTIRVGTSDRRHLMSLACRRQVLPARPSP